ncbi:MAG TPA: DoxX family protein [Burkholderiales bacterium]
MTTNVHAPAWATAAVLVGRLIFGVVFLMALAFKVMDMDGTAAYIESAGFLAPKVLAWLAALFELALAVCLLSGAFFAEAALLAAAYVLFLALAFHGPSHWGASEAEFGFFVDHFTFIAGLLFAAAHGPGARLAFDLRYLRTSTSVGSERR